MKYLLCELNDENYTGPCFSFHDSFIEAQNKAIDSIIESFKWDEGCDLKLETEDKLESEKKLKGIRITGNWTEKDDNDSFYVTEIIFIDESKRDHLLIWHHAYEGVGFTIEKQGTYEECLEEKKKQMLELIDEANKWGGDNSDLDIENIENESCIDTGNEWYYWSIISFNEVGVEEYEKENM